jgi:hypothetical protein
MGRKLTKQQRELRKILKSVVDQHPYFPKAIELSSQTMILDGEGFSISIRSDSGEELHGFHDRPPGYNKV